MKEQGGPPGTHMKPHICEKCCVCVSGYIQQMALMGLPSTISTAPSPLRILVKMARLQDSLLALLLMTLPSAEQGFGHFPRLPTTQQNVVAGTTGSSTMCCLFLETTVEKWIYSKCLPSVRSNCYCVQQLFFRAWACRYFLTYLKTKLSFLFFSWF